MRATAGLALLLLAPAALASAQDADGDGVSNAADAYPCDPTASGTAFAPAEGEHGAVLFEDQWPSQGDLDFNDVALTYNYVFRTNAAGGVVAIRATYNVLAVGGALHNGLGLALPVDRSSVRRVTRTVGGGSAQVLSPRGDAQLTVTLSDDLRELFGDQDGPLNSRPGELRIGSDPMVVEVELSTPASLPIGQAPFDVFVFRSERPAHEIHRPEYAGSLAMDAALFGTGDDGSTPGRRFVDVQGLPFAIVLPLTQLYPREETAISALFPDVVAFAASGGATHRDFYATSVVSAAAYRDAEGRPPLTPLLGALPAADRACIVVASVASYTHLDFLTVAEGGFVDSYQISDLAVDWERDRAYFLRSDSSAANAVIRSFPLSGMVEDQQARMSTISTLTPNNFPGTLHSDGQGNLFVVPGSSNSRPVLKIDAATYTETGRFGVSSSGLSNTTARLVATTWMAATRGGHLVTGSLFNDVAVLRISDMSYVWGAGQSIPESRVRGVVAGAGDEAWILGSGRSTSHTSLVLYRLVVGGPSGAVLTPVASFAPGDIEAGATAFYGEAGGLVYDATDGGLILQVQVAPSSGNVHTLKWRDGAVVWNVVTPWMINYQGPFESQNRLTRPLWAQMRARRVIQLDTTTGARILDQTMPFSEGGAQTYDSVSNRLVVRTDMGWTRIQFAP